MLRLILGIGSFGTFFIICAFGVSVALGAVCWPYTINTWLVFADRPPTVLWWHGALMGLVPGLGQLAILTAIATWIIMLFIGG